MKEFNLSYICNWDSFQEKALKVFIRLLKEKGKIIYDGNKPTNNIVLNVDEIDKLIGDKFTEETLKDKCKAVGDAFEKDSKDLNEGMAPTTGGHIDAKMVKVKRIKTGYKIGQHDAYDLEEVKESKE